MNKIKKTIVVFVMILAMGSGFTPSQTEALSCVEPDLERDISATDLFVQGQIISVSDYQGNSIGVLSVNAPETDGVIFEIKVDRSWKLPTESIVEVDGSYYAIWEGIYPIGTYATFPLQQNEADDIYKYSIPLCNYVTSQDGFHDRITEEKEYTPESGIIYPIEEPYPIHEPMPVHMDTAFGYGFISVFSFLILGGACCSVLIVGGLTSFVVYNKYKEKPAK